MNRKTLLLVLLGLPYLIWLVAIPLSGMQSDSVVFSLASGLSFVYLFGIIFWGIPYTTLVIGMLFWSRNKSAKEVYNGLSQFPLWLALVALVEFLIVFLYWELTSGNQVSLLEFVEGFFGTIGYSLMAMFGIFIYGYAFVFVSKGIYRVVERQNWFKDQ
jgi:hypothetical protein